MLTQFIETIRQRINRPLQYYEDICVRCGACIEACHFYAVSENQVHIPAYRTMLIKKLAQSDGGTFSNWYRESRKKNKRAVAELEQALWECTGCRRCAVYCPFDLDTALVISASTDTCRGHSRSGRGGN